MKLAKALNLRKQLAAKVEQLKPIKIQADQGLFVVKTTRQQLSDTVDNAVITIPRVTLADVTKTYDHYATQLRKLDDAIQETNWKTELEFDESDVDKVPAAAVPTEAAK